VEHDREQIAKAIRDQIRHGRYPSSSLFGDGTAGKRIADVLATVSPRLQKQANFDGLDVDDRVLGTRS
jgi:hypothetical protein